MSYKLVAVDLDGTLVGEDLTVAPATIAAVRAARELGVTTTIATGRMFKAARHFGAILGVDAPLICYHGALIRRSQSGETLYEQLMPPAPSMALVADMLAAGLETIAYVDEQLWVAARTEYIEWYIRFQPEQVDVVIAPDLARAVGDRPATKILFAADGQTVTRELARLTARFGGELGTVRSAERLGEFTAPGVSKGAALAQLAQILGVSRDEVIAIGDHENDISMIEWAGLGLAMGNAVEPVRQIADAVVPPVSEAGVARAIERYVLGR